MVVEEECPKKMDEEMEMVNEEELKGKAMGVVWGMKEEAKTREVLLWSPANN